MVKLVSLFYADILMESSNMIKNLVGRPGVKSKQDVAINIQVTPEFRDELKYYAELDDRPVGQFIKMVLKSYIKAKQSESAV